MELALVSEDWDFNVRLTLVKVLVAFIASASFALVLAFTWALVDSARFVFDQDQIDPRALKAGQVYFVTSNILRRPVLRLAQHCQHVLPPSHRAASLVSETIKGESEPGVKSPRDYTIGFLESWIRNLSDQQLATGTATLIAGFARRRVETIYQFELVTGLAFISSNVHFVAIGRLQNYFHENVDAKHWRAVLVTLFAALSFAANFLEGHYLRLSLIIILCSACSMILGSKLLAVSLQRTSSPGQSSYRTLGSGVCVVCMVAHPNQRYAGSMAAGARDRIPPRLERTLRSIFRQWAISTYYVSVHDFR